MKHSVKMQLRTLYRESKVFAPFYELASKIKIQGRQQLTDEEFLRKKFEENVGTKLNLDNPQTYNEKIQWLKLHDHNPLYTVLVDKFAVKQYVAEKIGPEHVIPIVGGPWYNAKEIEPNSLPKRFVLKCNHDCGSVIICTDKDTFDWKKAKKKLNDALHRNYYYVGREWPYKNVKPCIYAEQYVVDDDGIELRDYKFFCFDGVPRYLFIATDRMNKQEETKFDFFDMDFNHLPFTNGHPNAFIAPEKPKHFNEMKKLAETLSAGIPHVRVDFYEAEDQVYFGEMTFYHWGGMGIFDPKEWDYTFGSWIDLEKIRNSK